MATMVTLEELAQAALDRDGLRLRSLTQDFLSENPRVSDYARPLTTNQRVLCETESPLPLRQRRLYAPPNFLEFA